MHQITMAGMDQPLPPPVSRGAPLDWLDDALAELDRQSLRRRLTVRTSPQRGDEIRVDGQRLANFGSNDYLGLASDKAVVSAAQEALDTHGFGSGASPLITGRGVWHQRLERELAAFEGTESALLFPSGYAANMGTIAALVGKADAIFSDELNHASIIDGCRLSGAAVHIYRHGDASHLASLLAAAAAERRKLIVTDTLFSMAGDFAPLREIGELAGRHQAMLMVDEAHATGVFGNLGRGAGEHFGIEHDVHVRVGTLSKALGCSGGFVAGSQKLIDWLANRARSYFFSTAAPEINAAAALAALRIVKNEPRRRVELLSRSAALRARLKGAGLDVGDSESQIIPVIVGSPERALAVAAELRHRGYLVPAIRPPSVPEGQSLLRISVTWRHLPQELEDLASALIAVAG
ncbi:MAG TPA: 8-amino-7-oxononanoate synthase [Pirellulaceae bacterium]|nr:8-amino-7-oxononanoate synthase [Pirellulaceae bacterium]